MDIRRNAGLAGVVLAFAAAAAPAAAWEVQTVTTALGPTYSATLDLDPNGPCTPFCQPTPGDPGSPLLAATYPYGDAARFAYFDAVWWMGSFGNYSPGRPGEVSVAVDPGGVNTHLRAHYRMAAAVHAPYDGSPTEVQLLYAPGDLDEWYEMRTVDTVPLEGAITGVSVAVDDLGRAAVSYERRVWHDGHWDLQVMLAREQDGWQPTVVAMRERVAATAAGDTSLELLPEGLRLAYVLDGDLFVAGASAQPERVAGPAGCTVSGDLELAIDGAGRPHVAFREVCDDGARLRHATHAGEWRTATVRSAATLAGASMAIDGRDRPHFSWVEAGAVTYKRPDAAAEAVAAAEPRTTGVQVDLEGHAHLAYSGPDGLGHAYSGPPNCLGKRPTIVGTDAADRLRGTPGPDIIAGRGGADTITGAGGDDFICGGAGDDDVSGGDGIDRVTGGPGTDVLKGDLGDDHVTGDGGPASGAPGGGDTLFGGAGNDLLEDGSLPHAPDTATPDRMSGGDGNDSINGGAGDDRLDGGAGNDGLEGVSGNDSLFGGDGADQMGAGEGDDLLEGGYGVDRAFGDLGDDRILGGDGDDWLEGWIGADQLEGQAGNDRIEGGPGTDRLLGGPDDDWLDGGEDADDCEQGPGTGTEVRCES